MIIVQNVIVLDQNPIFIIINAILLVQKIHYIKMIAQDNVDYVQIST